MHFINIIINYIKVNLYIVVLSYYITDGRNFEDTAFENSEYQDYLNFDYFSIVKLTIVTFTNQFIKVCFELDIKDI